MNNNRTIPTPASADLPTFSILVKGRAVSLTYHISMVDVTRMYGKISTAKIILLDGDPAKGNFKISNTDDFKPGNEIEIRAGYHSKNETIFKGIIIRHGIKARKKQGSFLQIEARDKAVLLTGDKKSSYYFQVSDTDILEEKASKAGLQADIEKMPTKHQQMVQFDCSDWDFIISRASANACLVNTLNNQLVVKKPDTKADPVLHLVYGGNLLEFEAEMDVRNQVTAVQTFTWSPKGQELLEAEAAASTYNENGNISAADLAGIMGTSPQKIKHAGMLEPREIKSWAEGKLLQSRLAKIKGRASFQGFAGVHPGNMVQLKGVGERFEGKVLVTGVRHQINSKNWETDIQFGLGEELLFRQETTTEKQAGGLLPGIHGLQIAVVVKLEDPTGEDRIQVRMPVINTKGEGVWARLATFDAGKQRGAVFRPEINDEVVVGFLQDDPRYPIILGSLHSSSGSAPVKASDSNPEKGFISRTGLKMLFNEEAESIYLGTPAGKVIQLNEKEKSIVVRDEHQNQLEMTESGISIKTKGKLSMEADGDIEINGKEVQLNAKTELKAEGPGSKISLTTIAEMKASIVNIN